MGTEFRINSFTTGNQDYPHVAARNDGRFVVVWDSGPSGYEAAQDGAEHGVFGQRYDAAGIHAKFGVYPTQIPDYLGLAGDAVDDIPGVAGVGAKTAAALLAAFADIDALYADLDGVAALPIRGARTLGPLPALSIRN